MKIEQQDYWKAVQPAIIDGLLWPKTTFQELWVIIRFSKHSHFRLRDQIKDWAVDAVTDVVVLLSAFFVVMPWAITNEWLVRRKLRQGLLYTVGARTLKIPFVDKNLLEVDSTVFLHGSEDLYTKLVLKNGDMIMLVTDPDEGMFGLKKTWVFLHPEGRLIQVTWGGDRDILCTLLPAAEHRAKELKKKKKTSWRGPF